MFVQIWKQAEYLPNPVRISHRSEYLPNPVRISHRSECFSKKRKFYYIILRKNLEWFSRYCSL